ncbi:MAG: bifunctional nuclease family protein [Thermoanaerobaculia bacterium]
MRLKGLVLDPTSNLPIVILRDEESRLFLPIWVGVFEANAIALHMEEIDAPRPMTHDLLKNSLESLGAEVSRILISDLKDNTFYASIFLRSHNRQEVTLDSRPSDAIALAIRTKAPIFVLRSVLEKAQAFAISSAVQDEDLLKKWLDEADPEDLGKYKM